MLESSVYLENSGGGGASDGVSEGGSGGPAEDGGRNSPGNRLPDETSALLKLRSDMELAFKDSNLQSPFRDEVSRKLGELGFPRSPDKGMEELENIHKRTKDDDRSSRNSKSFRFLELLELADAHFPAPSPPLNLKQITSYATESNPISCSQELTIPCLFNQDRNAEFVSASTSSSGKESEGSVRKKKKKKKRKLDEYFERLMEDVLKKQEDLQNKFLEAIEKYEKDRVAREEAWKAQEMARIRREQEYLIRERRIAAAKDAAVLAFLQKITQQTNLQLDVPEILNPLFEDHAEKLECVMERHTRYLQENTRTKKQSNCAAGKNVSVQTTPSRWPKEEIEALIMLKTGLDSKYQDNGSKGPLWDDLSSWMKRLGYERSAKKCKEKWENINKYYKRVKDNKKIRLEDSKTCSYFSMLEDIYSKKSNTPLLDSDNGDRNLKPEQILMQMIGQTHQQTQS